MFSQIPMAMQQGIGGKAAGAGQLFGGLFGDSGAPYEAAEKEYQDYLKKSQNYQNPFYNAGTGAIPQYQEWLNSQKDPSGFINGLMDKYQESPWAKYEQNQATRAAQNQGSASGLTGSTPLTQFAQQNAANISSQDMQNWLQNVLGINTQYGAGVNNMMTGGQNAANNLSTLTQNAGNNIAEAQYGKKAGEQQDQANIWGGLLNLLF